MNFQLICSVKDQKVTLLMKYQKCCYHPVKGRAWSIPITNYRDIPCKNGKCAVTRICLLANDARCHHKLPRDMGGTAEFNTLIIVHKFVHRLIYATNEETIRKYTRILQLNDKQLKKINKLRKVCNLVALV